MIELTTLGYLRTIGRNVSWLMVMVKSLCAAVKSAEATLDGAGRVLLRPSGTEPLLRVMVEGRDGAQVMVLAEAIADAVRHAIGE